MMVTASPAPCRAAGGEIVEVEVSLYTILSLPILYGVWPIKGGSGEGSYMAQKSRNSIAVVWVMRIGGGNKGMIDSCTHKNKWKHILYRPSARVRDLCSG